MADFRRDDRRGGFGGAHSGGGFRGGKPRFGDKNFRGNDHGPVIMNKAICDQCHKQCEVPFRPTAGKPVYCNDCFGGKRETGPKKGFGGDYKTPPRTDFGNDVKKVSGEEIKKQIEVLNVKIDKLARLIEAMTVSKPAVVESVPASAKSSSVAKKVKKVSKKK